MFESLIFDRLSTLKTLGLWRSLKAPQGISFSHNDYLGLSGHPRLVDAGKKALDRWGTGSRGSRLLGGHSVLFEEVEEAIAHFFGSPTSLFFSTGYLANQAALNAIAPFVDVIYSDEKNHASLIDGISLTKVPKVVVPHGQWDEFNLSEEKRVLVVSESLFSMDGDFVDEDAVSRALNHEGAFLMLDEAHAAGVFGEGGRGVHPFFHDWDRKIVTVTFGKAFGVSGAAVLCSRKVKELLINTARSFIYTTAPSPVTVAMVGESIKLVSEHPELGQRLRALSRKVRDRLRTLTLLPNEKSEKEQESPIVPLLISGENRALRFCENMRESNIELKAIRYPTVPRGAERVRISLNLTNSEQETDLLIETVEKKWKAFS